MDKQDKNRALVSQLVDWILIKIQEKQEGSPKAVIGIYKDSGESIFPKGSRPYLNDFCQEMFRNKRLTEKCNEDHKKRGQEASMTGRKEVKPCHCGLYNVSCPITVAGKHVGTILAGQKLIRNDLQNSYEMFKKFLSENKDIISDVNMMKELYDKTPKVRRVYFDDLIKLLEEGYKHIFQVYFEWQEVERLRKLEEKRKEIISHKLLHFQTCARGDLKEIAYHLDQDDDIDGAREYLDYLVQNLMHLTCVTRNFLWLKTDIVGYFKEWDISKIVHENIKIFNRMILHKNLNININSEKDLPKVSCSKEHIKQVIYNLMHNAIMYSKEECIEINLKTTDKNFLSMEFKNYGVEIPQNVFKDEYVGNLGPGLGLPIVKRIIEAHKGKIDIKSTRVGKNMFFNTLTLLLPFNA